MKINENLPLAQQYNILPSNYEDWRELTKSPNKTTFPPLIMMINENLPLRPTRQHFPLKLWRLMRTYNFAQQANIPPSNYED